MKELSIEAKAQKYDNLIERLKDFQFEYRFSAFSDTIGRYFPELEETSDEKIIKWIIDDIRYNMNNELLNNSEYKKKAEKAIAWLEKQGNIDKVSYEIAEKEKHDFVSGQFIECRKSFNEFKENNSYWFEYVGNDIYIGRSDNILNKKFHITPRQLYRLFTQQHCPKENNVNEETNAPTAYGKYVDECLNEAAKHFLSEGEDKYSIADLFYAGVRCGQSWIEKHGNKDKLIQELGEYKVKYTQEVLEKYMNTNNKDDERLRKTTIDFLKEFADKGYENAVECIDWLERQGKLDKIIEKAKNEKQRVLLTETDGNASIDWDTRNLEDARMMLEYGLNFIKKEIENQGEQKDPCTNCNHKMLNCSNFPCDEKKIFEKTAKEGKVDNQNCVKLTNKIEPKFKIGDWIVATGKVVYQIKESKNFCVTLVEPNGHESVFDVSVLNDARLWDISKDANEGDVLFMDNGAANCIFIYKSSNNGIINKYASYNKFGFESEHYLVLNDGYVIPATKEQRDTLEKAVADAGYTFDFEKKELKKIPNAFEECEIVHVEHGKYYYCIKDYYAGGNKRASKGDVVQALNGMSMMALGVKANEYFIPVNTIKQMSAWSEEDEKEVAVLEAYIRSKDWSERHIDRALGIVDELVNKAKSLKSQLKQEWGEEDETNASYICAALDCYHRLREERNNTNGQENLDKARNWLYNKLKSLRPQTTWKPNEEQIKALEMAVEGNIPQPGIIQGILEQLKSL